MSRIGIQVLLLTLVLAAGAKAQSGATPRHVDSSAAFAEVALRSAELSADIEAMLEQYTENHPNVVRARTEASSLDGDVARLKAVKPEDAGKLTSALGKLIVRKAGLFAEYRALEKQYDNDHPEVRRAKKRYEVFASRVNEILGK